MVTGIGDIASSISHFCPTGGNVKRVMGSRDGRNLNGSLDASASKGVDC